MSFFFSSRRRHTRCSRDWSSDVCSSDLGQPVPYQNRFPAAQLSAKLLQKDNQTLRVVTASASLKKQTAATPVPPITESGSNRHLRPIEGVNQDRCFAFRRPGSPDRGALRDSAFVFKENRGFSSTSVFFYRWPFLGQPKLHFLRITLASLLGRSL